MHIPHTGEEVRSLWLPGASSQVNQELCPLKDTPPPPQNKLLQEKTGEMLVFSCLNHGNLWLTLFYVCFHPQPPLPAPPSLSAPLCPVCGPGLRALWTISPAFPWALTSQWVWAMRRMGRRLESGKRGFGVSLLCIRLIGQQGLQFTHLRVLSGHPF